MKMRGIALFYLLLVGEGLFGCLAIAAQESKVAVDVIMFSKDRPLQLYASLESFDEYVKGINNIFVIYHARDDRFALAYKEVRKNFPAVVFIEQSRYSPRSDFKSLVSKTLTNSRASHIAFSVDDIIITDYIDVLQCASWLQKTGAYGFYLRMGKDITEGYLASDTMKFPDLIAFGNDVYSWQFSTGSNDWCYPNTLDMTIFVKEMVQSVFQKMSFTSPNTLESTWSGKADFSLRGLCFGSSKVINIPLNLAQVDWGNPFMGSEYTVLKLLDLFEKGYKIDIHEVFQLPHHAAHVNHTPLLVLRTANN
jgi:hypothetical protein